MKSPRQAREQGKLDRIVKGLEGDDPGDEATFNRAVARYVVFRPI